MKIKALKARAPQATRKRGKELSSTGLQIQSAIRQLRTQQANHIAISDVTETEIARLRAHIGKHSKILGCPVKTYMSGDDLIVTRL